MLQGSAQPDEWGPPIGPYGPYGPGVEVIKTGEDVLAKRRVLLTCNAFHLEHAETETRLAHTKTRLADGADEL